VYHRGMLRPCPGCRRHVAAEPACPFCGVKLPPLEPPRATVHGRFSRAAVFAGATLAGCWTGKGDAPVAPVEHRDTPIDQPHTDVPKDPTVVRTPGTIEGIVTNQATGLPIAGAVIELQSHATNKSRSAVTDGNGHYAFLDVEPGDYDLIGMRSNNPRRAPQQSALTVGDGAQLHRDLKLYIQPVSNIPMPYGAPPARRRVV